MSRKAEIAVAPIAEQNNAALSLSELCSEAAQHVAEARIALFAEDTGPDEALAHLDQAIGCLKRMLARGKSLQANGRAATPRPC